MCIVASKDRQQLGPLRSPRRLRPAAGRGAGHERKVLQPPPSRRSGEPLRRRRRRARNCCPDRQRGCSRSVVGRGQSPRNAYEHSHDLDFEHEGAVADRRFELERLDCRRFGRDRRQGARKDFSGSFRCASNSPQARPRLVIPDVKALVSASERRSSGLPRLNRVFDGQGEKVWRKLSPVDLPEFHLRGRATARPVLLRCGRSGSQRHRDVQAVGAPTSLQS